MISLEKYEELFFAPDNPASSARKILRDNQIYILRGDHTYTLTGQEVR